ncbi:MAG: protein kinase [Kofleriaceae bacterium]|nr:protein kinase [Myxococcales bacterium]MCB9565172.1 protein kinase [Kofleriaceae bacterium]MCB9572177.1 protein kinase [Kofleriaceae bacterium]
MTDRPGFFRRLFGRGRAPAALAEPPRAEPVHLGPEEETWLSQLVADVGEGRRLDQLASPEVFAQVDALWKSGHERLALEWLRKLIAIPDAPAAAVATLRARLVELHELRVELDEALPHLEALTADPAHALRAHFLLGEHYRRRGDDARALRHYEAVLALDVDYPNVRARVDRLRAARGVGAPTAGETIAGVEVAGVHAGQRYRLVRELGRGATGVVYLARDLELERDVAIKLLHPHVAGARSADALARFFHEARVTASLRHPNIVAVLDLDEDARRIVMELAAGGTLRDVVRERGPRNLRRALERHTQVLSALSAAHRRGIVHLDLKPANLMFRRDADLPGAEVMLGDFGIAHLPDVAGATGAAAAESRRPAEAAGTLAYMSPEQRAGVQAPPCDVYATAVVLFEMLTGRYPWPRETLLTGTRRRGDFRLPDDVEAPAVLRDQVQAHLDALGDPDPAQRPTADAALAVAQGLRQAAIARDG